MNFKNTFIRSVASLAFLIGSCQIYAATCNSLSGTSASPANYNSASTWSCAAVPSSSDIINISHYVTLTGNQTFQWQTQTITIKNGGYFKVVGDLTIQGSAEKLVIESGGTLEVTGTLTIQNGGATLDVESGGTLKAGTLANNYGSTVTVKSSATARFGTLNVGNSNSAFFVNNGSTTVTGNVLVEGSATNAGTMNVGGSFTVSSSSSATLTSSGSLTITGNASSANQFKVSPNGYVYVGGSFTTTSSESLTVGTDVAPTPYANMVIAGDLLSASSGDVRIKDNGRLAIFSDFERTTNNGGILITIEDKGQLYIAGNINLAGANGGNSVTNQNATNSYGFYLDGTTSNVTIPSNTSNSTAMQTTNPTFYNWIASQPGSPLVAMPVTILYFRTASEQANGILLEWCTAMEKDFKEFQVEASSDGRSFSVVGKVTGTGNSDVPMKYSFSHSSPNAGRNYYRLKSVDIDDSFNYSNVITAIWIGPADRGLSVYPNPVIGREISVDLTGDNALVKEISIQDQNGKVVWESSVDESGPIVLAENFESGVYMVTLVGANWRKSARMIVR